MPVPSSTTAPASSSPWSVLAFFPGSFVVASGFSARSMRTERAQRRALALLLGRAAACQTCALLGGARRGGARRGGALCSKPTRPKCAHLGCWLPKQRESHRRQHAPAHRVRAQGSISLREGSENWHWRVLPLPYAGHRHLLRHALLGQGGRACRVGVPSGVRCWFPGGRASAGGCEQRLEALPAF